MGHDTNITCKLSTSMTELSCSQFGKAFQQVMHCLAGTKTTTKKKKRLWAVALSTLKNIYTILHITVFPSITTTCSCVNAFLQQKGYDLGPQKRQNMSCVLFISNHIICLCVLIENTTEIYSPKISDGFLESFSSKRPKKKKKEEYTKRAKNGSCWRAVVFFFSSPRLHRDGLTEGSLGRGRPP